MSIGVFHFSYRPSALGSRFTWAFSIPFHVPASKEGADFLSEQTQFPWSISSSFYSSSRIQVFMSVRPSPFMRILDAWLLVLLPLFYLGAVHQMEVEQCPKVFHLSLFLYPYSHLAFMGHLHSNNFRQEDETGMLPQGQCWRAFLAGVVIPGSHHS